MKRNRRRFCRLGIIALAFFITGNLLDCPSETEAIIRAGVGGFGGMRSGGSYHSNYGGRVVWQSFGRGSGRRNKYEEPVDKNRAYYEKKMAEWREKNKDVLAALKEKKKLQGEDEYEYTDSSEANSSGEYEYEYEETTTTTASTTAVPVPTTEKVQTTTNEEVSLASTTIGVTGNATELLETTSTTEATVEGTTPTISTTTTTTTTTPRRFKKHFGLRYGRVRVERLQ